MKKCPYCAEEIQDEAIVCRYCGRDLQAPAQTVQMNQVETISQPETPSDQKPRKKSNMAGILVLLILLACGIFWAISSTQGSKPSQPTGSDAFYMCQTFLEKRLKAPSTAKFASLTDSTVKDLGSSSYSVRSYVDSQNGFGAMLRTTYVCQVSYQGNDQWKLVSLDTY